MAVESAPAAVAIPQGARPRHARLVLEPVRYSREQIRNQQRGGSAEAHHGARISQRTRVTTEDTESTEGCGSGKAIALLSSERSVPSVSPW
jgi:hypothetical protein